MMQAVHGGTASNTTSGANGPSALPKHHRYSSRSNSFSSASIVTVKRTASLSSSSTSARNSGLPMRAQSPSDTSLIALRVSREQMSQGHSRRRSVAVDPTERPAGDGMAGTNYTHSTQSSVSSIGNKRRSRASSGALVQPFSPPKKGSGTIDYSPRSSTQIPLPVRPRSQKQRSPASSPDRTRRRPARPDQANPVTALPPLHTTPGLTDPNDTASPSTIQTIATPSTQTAYPQDYFVSNVSPRKDAKSRQPISVQNYDGSGMNSSRLLPIRPSQEMEERDHPIRPSSSNQREEDSRPTTADNGRQKRSRTRERGGDKDKKAMLAKALSKANTAVLLDNAANFEGALEAYTDACDLLQQVMERSSGADDKRKLDAIRETYTTRIEELQQLESARLELSADEKDLPARPESEYSLRSPSPVFASHGIAAPADVLPAVDERPPVLEKAFETPPQPREHTESDFSHPEAVVQDNGDDLEYPQEDRPLWMQHSRRKSSQADVSTKSEQNSPVSKTQDVQKRDPRIAPLKMDTVLLTPPEDHDFMPVPLSPRRLSSPKRNAETEQASYEGSSEPLNREAERKDGPAATNVPNSSLDTIDESNTSCRSSVHSMSSDRGLRRKNIRGVSTYSFADFDAAFDAAVEAAYGEGLEPDLEARKRRETAQSQRKQSEVGSIAVRASEIQEITPANDKYRILSGMSSDDEEERLLEDIAQDYVPLFGFDSSSKSALPRQSDSSGYSRSTWQSSDASNRTTAGTSLSTVAEDTLPALGSKNAFATQSSINSVLAEPTLPSSPPPPPPPPSHPPPQTSLPKTPGMSQNRISGVRSRRLSGRDMKQLKIETSTITATDARKRASTIHHAGSPFKENEEGKSAVDSDYKYGALLEPVTASDTTHDGILRSPPSLELPSATFNDSRPTTATTTEQRPSLEDEARELITQLRPSLIKKNKSSVSLREHTLLIASPTLETAPSLFTPLSSTFMTFASKRNNETPLTSQRAAAPTAGHSLADTLNAGGVFLFDTSLSAGGATSPKSPVQSTGLEPCPESNLLRPFWLMRSISGTLTHPKGSFLTSRLFVPREVWQTKGVKIKAIEDKIAGCDLLTAALGKLSTVDTYDADAVMEELQGFEEVMERVQSTFVKKLGTDVGISGMAGLFKDAAAAPMASSPATGPSVDTTLGAEKTRSKESKGFSWRKLRSKSSGAPVSGSSITKASNKGTDKESLTMESVPMTSFVPVERRGQRRDAKNAIFEGPNRDYMESLARLFDAVHVLDQIARQVEDPGLKGTSKTHVGLELSIRHASEFFGFYVCRFVLIDIGALIDKFIKRGTEWTLL